ncbi:hypothetical protein BOH72_13990 [Mycobacterium sp. WY10]|nr:hypothetical protein BOH72_13990 [Mycobacterium sp. WY10]
MTITAPPDDATELYEWYDRDGQPVRDFTGFVREIDGGISVEVAGTQTVDGITRAIYISAEGQAIRLTTVEQIDVLVAALSGALASFGGRMEVAA